MANITEIIKNTNSQKQIAQASPNPISEKSNKALRILGIALLTALRPILFALISSLRAQLLVYTNKKLKVSLRKTEFILMNSDLESLTNQISSVNNFLGRIPTSALKVIPGLQNAAEFSKSSVKTISAKTRSTTYALTLLNNKQNNYDILVQQLDNLIRDLKGIIDAIDAELEEGTV